MPLQRREDGGRPPCNCRDGIVIPTKIGAAGAARAVRIAHRGMTMTTIVGMGRRGRGRRRWSGRRTTRLGGGQGVGELAIYRITTAATAGAGNGGGNRGSGEGRQQSTKAAEIGAETAVVAAATAAAVAAAAATTAPTAAEAASEVDGHLTQ